MKIWLSVWPFIVIHHSFNTVNNLKHSSRKAVKGKIEENDFFIITNFYTYYDTGYKIINNCLYILRLFLPLKHYQVQVFTT